MKKTLTACQFLFCLVLSQVQADGIIYVATQETEDLPELFYSNVSGSGGNITASPPIKLSAPQPVNGGVVYAIPNFGNPDEVLYGANQDDPSKMELYIVDLSAPGTSTKVNAALTSDQTIEAGITCPDGTKVFHDLRSASTGTLDLYVVTISNPGVATKLNPDLAVGREVGAFVITPDCTKVVYEAQINSSAEELFVTELSNPGVATKADGPPSGADHVIQQLSLSVDGTTVFWIAGPGQIGQNRDLYTVALNDLGNDVQVNPTFQGGGQVADYDVSPDANTIVYRAKVSPVQASNVFVVDLSSGSPSSAFQISSPPGTASQVNPNWATGGTMPFFGTESVALLENGTIALYNGPIDDPDVGELYETPLSALQTSTKVNDTLGTPLSGFQGISLFQQSPDDSLVTYSDGIGGGSSIHVVDRSNPGSAVQPFSPGQDQQLTLLATFNSDSDLVASIITNVDAQGNPVSGELHAADPTVGSTNVRVNTDLAAGFGVLTYFWLPVGAPVVSDADTDGDGNPDSTDPDDDNDGIGDSFDDEPLQANNFCSGLDPFNVTFQQVVANNISCAAQVSISVVPQTTVQSSGNLRLISPTVSFQSGFSVAGGLTVISAHPCPGCSP